MSWHDVLAATALEQAALIRRRAVSSEELVRLYLDRIEALDGQLHAFVAVFRRRALLQARLKDAQVRLGARLPAFHGVPTGIKDLNLVRFTRTRFGSAALPPIWSPLDDRTTAAVRRGGFVIVGKLASSELGAMPVTEPDIHPPTRNPWHLGHTAGGSSGGSSAAVAAGLLPIAQGSDGGGSVRIPSAFCHLYGIKPSRGRVPEAFGRPDRDVLYTSGPMARSVEDAAAMLDVMAGLDVGRPHWAPAPPRPYRALCTPPSRPFRIGVTTRPSFGATHPEVAAAVTRAARLLADLGHEVDEVATPGIQLDEFLPLWQHLIATFPLVKWQRTQPITRWLAAAGRSLRAPDMIALRRRLAERIVHALGPHELWIMPTVAVPPPRVGAFSGRAPAEAFTDAARLGAFTAGFNITGQPAASVPLGLTSEGLPIGLQIVGRLLGEADVLALSRQLEEAAPWRGRLAPLARAPQ